MAEHKMQWQPIETAPEKTLVLVYGEWDGELHGGDGTKEVHKARFEWGEWWIDGGEYYASHVRNPTHWMPLPEPPNAA